ncbi:hypothetical protein [Spirosoma radiotolerans]|uniref:Uncharacterized protein n=1 Tax=Spirosoma radiotolerans TaxID=1379870 RepID=A0A0E3V628_9BACT|nr:hypothetical protein [Spirosoma radiotolerans]AKD54667.1 hypothetical protein SD10_06845 [Spirosoma radiotolerans]
MTTLEHVQRKAQSLKDAFEKVQSNHFYWQRKTKPLLDKTLTQIQESTDLNWTFQNLSPELVRLVLNDGQGQQMATLSFRLTYKSLVSIDMSYYSQTYQPDAKSETFLTIYSLEPGLIDESLIYSSVTQLMDQLLKEYGPLPSTYKDPHATPNTIRIRTNVPNS